jgi:glyceraldehyde 3-phosphate dehydrogenase
MRSLGIAMRIGINGFGRTGRQVLRTTMEKYPGKLEVVAINTRSDVKTSAHLLKYDTNYGMYPGIVEAHEGALSVDGQRIIAFAESSPEEIPWNEAGVDVVIESTGFFTDAASASGHLKGGAKKVIISAPAKDEDITIVFGVNEELYRPAEHTIVSNASCTTNCIAPMAKILQDSFGIKHGLMSTVHAYTNDQQILDKSHKDLRRSRAAAQNIIPTSTGAAKVVGMIMPELAGRIHGLAFRVPVSTVSATDFVAELDRPTSVDEVNAAFQEAARGSMNGILDYTEEPLVSSDFKGNPHSCIIDGLTTIVVDDTMVKVVGWYDNEWGYATRISDFAALIADKGL